MKSHMMSTDVYDDSPSSQATVMTELLDSGPRREFSPQSGGAHNHSAQEMPIALTECCVCR